MELDGYCESLKLAFEHHGEQHYKAVSFFTKREEEFKKRRSHDEVKKRLCALHGIVLIEVPEIPRLLPLEHVRDYIKKECERASVPIPIDFDIKKINWKKAYATDGLKATLAELRAIAEARGGRCLLDVYVNSTTKLLWECKVKHQWEAPPSMIKSGNWCPYCAGTIKLSIAEMHQLAEKRSGKCLSETYVNNRTKLLWQCTKGHQWAAIPRNIKRGQWCRICTGYAKLTIDEMREIAEKHGGKCLSDSYINSKTKLFWQCAKGHQWEAIPSSIKRGQWCSKCAGIDKLTIEEMHKIAEARNGKYLSDSYINSKTKLLWECKKKHQWEAAPVTIKAGKWCRVCAGNAKLTIGELQKIAEEHGGKCLSDSYINFKTKLLWECAKGHQWEAIPSNIKRGQWCWECYQSKRGVWGSNLRISIASNEK